MSSSQVKLITLIYYKTKCLKKIDSTAVISHRYDDLQTCIDYFNASDKNDILFLIVSGLDALDIVPKINHLRQLDSIFIIAGKEDGCKTPSSLERYAKIIDYFEENENLLTNLTESIEENIDLCRKQIESFKFYDQHQKSTRQLSEEHGSFLWLQLFKQVVLQLPHDDEAKQEMVEKLREYYHNNNKQLKLISKFNETYKPSEALRWYTGQPFIYKQINRALRTEDIELLYKFRYFISDVCRYIEKKYVDAKEYELKLKLYRGVRMSKTEINRLQQNIGKLISTNGFLSTSMEEDVALGFVGMDDSEQQRSVLFEIDCDLPLINHVRLASLREFSDNYQEEEILFDLDTVFEILSIESNDKNLIRVQMKVSDEGRKTAQTYIEHVKKDISGVSTARIVFGRLLTDMGQYDKCETYFEHLLNSHQREEDTAFLYYYLAAAKAQKGYYDQALQTYQISYDLLMQANPPRLWPSASVLSDIGGVFSNKGQYKQATEYHNRAINIREQLSDYRGLATSLENMAIIFKKQGDYDCSLANLTKCLEFRKKLYPEEHEQIANCLMRTAGVYRDRNELNLALDYEKQALKINEQCLPGGHPRIAESLHYIGQTLYFQGRFDEALDYYMRSLNMRERAFATTGEHPTVATSLSSIGMIYYSKNEFTLALEYYRRAMKIRETFGLMDSDQAATTLMKIGMALCKQEKYEEALPYYKQSLEVKEKVFPFGHFEIVDCLTNLGNAYRDMGNFDQAFQYFQQAKEHVEFETVPKKMNFIRLSRLTDNMGIAIGRLHGDNDDEQRLRGLEYRLEAVRLLSRVYPRLDYARWMETIGDVFCDYNRWSKAIECYRTALRMKEKCTPFNSKEVVTSRRMLGRLFLQKHDDNEHRQYRDYILARMHYEKALVVIMRESSSHESNCYATVLNAIGSIYEKTSKYSLALQHYEKAFVILSAIAVNYVSSEDGNDDDEVDQETVEMNVARMEWLTNYCR
ncbi:unnamed protein product [Didymodactylos carnosus]|uniref:ADP ribosyltransferase domain-containing protein n=1 Tax=Didymodactylos carnosus TaxID=1234261 RepID=A0A815B6R1_9BILA|nr:unnamed protein product [Didymodactylos carnosus]CAF4049153.1 unnamed protein product [Didymodactylos carnosus]